MKNARIVVWVLACLVLVGCKPTIPDKYIQPDELEDILYDYHIADAMGNIFPQRDDTLQMNVYRKSVLDKYGYTEAQFDSSMIYYVRHAELLYKIYESLSDRIDKEASALGVATDELNSLSTLSSTGDTANIWTANRTLMLVQYPGFNQYSFEIKPDTSFRPGDKFVLNSDAQFIYKNGSRHAVMVLALTLGNDSVVSRVCQMSSSMHYTLNISDDKRLGIKRIRGYFFQAKNMSEEAEIRNGSLRILLLSNIALVRMHTLEPFVHVSAEPSDSLKADSLPNKVPKEPKQMDIKLKATPVPRELKVAK